MATEVSSLMRLLTRHVKAGAGGNGAVEGSRGDLVTRDLLGSGWTAPPAGGRKERGLGVMDLNTPLSCSPAFPPPSRPAVPLPHGFLREQPAAALDLGLRPSAPPHPAEYQSVCTLEKVRSALERAQRESSRRRLPSAPAASPSSSSTTASSAKRLRAAGPEEEGETEAKPSPSSSSTSSSSVVVQGGVGAAEDGGCGMAAAGCPCCLLYVLISRSDPRCPRCNSTVPLPPAPGKRRRIDLNAAAITEPAEAIDTTRTLHFI